MEVANGGGVGGGGMGSLVTINIPSRPVQLTTKISYHTSSYFNVFKVETW